MKRMVSVILILNVCLAANVLAQGTETIEGFSGNSVLDKGPLSASLSFMTLQPVQSIPVWQIDTRTGFKWALALNYSGNVYKNAKKNNASSPVSWVGLGWSMGAGSIVADQGQTRDINDDRWFFRSGDGTTSEILRNEQSFRMEKLPYWKVSTTPAQVTSMTNILGWELTDEAGTKYRFGDFAEYDPFSASRNILASPDHLGTRVCAFDASCTAFGFFINQWDLGEIVDAGGGKINFTYQQFREGSKWPHYTRESYLSKVESDNGDKIVFELGTKDENEFSVFNAPQAFSQDETKFLSKLTVSDGVGRQLDQISFGYSSATSVPLHINNTRPGSAKRQLLSINSQKNLDLNIDFSYAANGLLNGRKSRLKGGALSYTYTNIQLQKNLKESLPLNGFTAAQYQDGLTITRGNHIFILAKDADGQHHTRLNIFDLVDNKWVPAAINSTLPSGTHIYPGYDYYVETTKITDDQFQLRVWEWRNKKWVPGEFKQLRTSAPLDRRVLDLDELMTVIYPEKNYFIVHEGTHPLAGGQPPCNPNHPHWPVCLDPNFPFKIPQTNKLYVYNLVDGKWVSGFNAPDGTDIPDASHIEKDFNHDANGEGWNLPQPIFNLHWRIADARVFTSKDRFVIQYGISRIEDHEWGCGFFTCDHECNNCPTAHREYLFDIYEWTGTAWLHGRADPVQDLYPSPSDGNGVARMDGSYYTFIPNGIQAVVRNGHIYHYTAAGLQSSWSDYVNDESGTSPIDWIFSLSADRYVNSRFTDNFFISTIPFYTSDEGNQEGFPRIMVLKPKVPEFGTSRWEYATTGLDAVNPYTGSMHWPRMAKVAIGKDYIVLTERPDGNGETWMMVYKYSEALKKWVRTLTTGAGGGSSAAHKVDGQEVPFTRVFPVGIARVEAQDDYFIAWSKDNRFFWLFRWNSSEGKWESQFNGGAPSLTDAQVRDPNSSTFGRDKHGEGIRYPVFFDNVTASPEYFAVHDLDHPPALYFYNPVLKSYSGLHVETAASDNKDVLDQEFMVSTDPAELSNPGILVKSFFLGEVGERPFLPIVQSISMSDGVGNADAPVNLIPSTDAAKQDFDRLNGVGYFGTVSSVLGNGLNTGKVVYDFLFDYGTNLFGMPTRTSFLDPAGALVGYDEQDWEAKRLSLGKRDFFIPRLVKSTTSSLGVMSSREFPGDAFDESNGLPTLSIQTNSNGEAMISKTIFAHEKYSGLVDKNIISVEAGRKNYLVSNYLNSGFATEFSSGVYTIYSNPSRQAHVVFLSAYLPISGGLANVDVPVSTSSFSPPLTALSQGDVIQVSFRIRTASLFAVDEVDIGLKLNNENVAIPFNDRRIRVITIPHTYTRGFVIPQSAGAPTYLALNLAGISENLQIDFLKINIIKNPTPSDKLVSATATTWKEFGAAGWRPEANYAWNVPMNGSGRPTVAFSEFNYATPGISSPFWETNGKTTGFDGKGRLVEVMRADGFKTTTIYGHGVGHNTGSIVGASFDESGVLTGDYDLDETIVYGSTQAYSFDKANGWEKGEAILEPGISKFGAASIHLALAQPIRRNFKIHPDKNYIFSAWIKVVSGTFNLSGDYRKLKAGASATFPFELGPHVSDFGVPPATTNPSNSDWQYVELKIPAKTDVFGNDWYARVFLGSPNSGEAYVNDVRFYPEDALVTSAYFDPTFRVPIAKVDANNNASFILLDPFGRVRETKNSIGQTLKTITYDLAGD